MARQARKAWARRETARIPFQTIGTWLMAAMLGLSGTGCQHLKNYFHSDPYGAAGQCHVDPQLEPRQLIAHVNANAAKLHGWRSSSATITGGGLQIALKGTTIAVEEPRNFRLLAKHPLGSRRVADLGSNNEQFWFWFEDTKRDPEVIMCNHADVAYASRAMPIPFEPDWLMEVMGVREIELDDNPNFVIREGFLEIYNKRVSPDGREVTKRTTIDRCHGTVVEHALLDAGGQPIATAIMSQFAPDHNTGVVLPMRMDLSWPRTNMSLTIRLNSVEIDPATSPAQCQMPQDLPVRQITPQHASRPSFTPGQKYADPVESADVQPADSAVYGSE